MVAKFGSGTPLYIASQNGHSSIVETLIKCGANVNAVAKVSCFVYECTYHLTSFCFVLLFRINALHYILLQEMVIVQQ